MSQKYLNVVAPMGDGSEGYIGMGGGNSGGYREREEVSQ